MSCPACCILGYILTTSWCESCDTFHRFVSFFLRIAHDKADQVQAEDGEIVREGSLDVVLLDQVEKLGAQILTDGKVSTIDMQNNYSATSFGSESNSDM